MNPAYDHVVPCGRKSPHAAHSYDGGDLWFVTCPGRQSIVVDAARALRAAAQAPRRGRWS